MNHDARTYAGSVMSSRTMPCHALHRNRGFTLLELLIAVTILSVMTGIYVVQLSQASAANERMQARSDELKSLQRFFNLLAQDLEHLVERPVRGELDSQPALLGAEQQLEFTRQGWPNPMLLMQRGPLKRVAYSNNEGTIVRQLWQHLDRGTSGLDEGGPTEKALLENVVALSFEFLMQNPDDLSFEWKEQWPEDAAAGVSGSLSDPMPLVIRVTVELERLGSVYRYFSVTENRFDPLLSPANSSTVSAGGAS